MAQESWHELGTIEVTSGAVAVMDAAFGIQTGCLVALPNGTYKAVSHGRGRSLDALYLTRVGVKVELNEQSVLGQTWSDAARVAIADSRVTLGGGAFMAAFAHAYEAKGLPKRGLLKIGGDAVAFSRTGYDGTWDIIEYVTSSGDRAGLLIAF